MATHISFAPGSGPAQAIEKYLQSKAGKKNESVIQQLDAIVGDTLRAEMTDALNTPGLSRIGAAFAKAHGSAFRASTETTWKVEILTDWLKKGNTPDASADFDQTFETARAWTAENQKPGMIDMNEDTEAAWPLFSEKTPDEMYEALTKGLPKGTEVEIVLTDEGKLDTLCFNYTGSEGKFTFNRYHPSDAGENVMDHMTGSVNQSLRGSGTSRKVQANTFRLYEECGIEKATLSAQDMGAYAWAKLGFAPTEDAWEGLTIHLNERLDFLTNNPPPEGALPQAVVDKMRDAVNADDPKKLWDVADEKHACYGTTLGKVMLMPFNELPESFPVKQAENAGLNARLSWDGELDMKDTDCVQRYKKYLYGDRQPAATVPAPATALSIPSSPA